MQSILYSIISHIHTQHVPGFLLINYTLSYMVIIKINIEYTQEGIPVACAGDQPTYTMHI